MEQHQKVSGRQRQLLKLGVTTDKFSETLLSSSWIPVLKHSHTHSGLTDQTPQDWQIDLGNFCNSACVFCSPHSSSRLATEYHKLGLIEQMPSRAWCDDKNLLDSFIQDLKKCNRITYLHFIGGETLITPAFRKILDSLVAQGLHRVITLGFTTNLTVWDQELVELLCQFHSINLGMSVECFHPLNDYVRYGSDIGKVEQIAKKWLQVASQQQWLTQLRVTPNVLSIWYLDTVYEFALQNRLAVESCNFLDHPQFMQISVLPQHMRLQVIDRLQSWVDQNAVEAQPQIVNTRHLDFYHAQIVQDATSYLHYLREQPERSDLQTDLVKFLTTLENNRHNRILDYLPEYEQFLRSAGYQ